jgi:CHAT domain-containing protein
LSNKLRTTKFIIKVAVYYALCISYANVFAQTHHEHWKNLVNQSVFDSNQGNHEVALNLAKSALNLVDANGDHDSHDVAISLNLLAYLHNKLGQYDEALPLQQRHLNLVEKTHGAEGSEAALSLNSLAWTYNQLARYDDAISQYERALKIKEKVLGLDHPNINEIRKNLANSYANGKNYSEAISLYQKALSSTTTIRGRNSLESLELITLLARSYALNNEFSSALPLQLEAISIGAAIHGSESLNVVTALDDAAQTESDLGQYEKALPMRLQALSILEKIYGVGTIQTVWGINNLAHTYSDLAQYDKALPLLEKAFSIRENVLGYVHSETADSLNNLLSVYYHLGQHDKILPLIVRVLAIYEKLYGSESYKTAIALKNLSSIYAGLGRKEEALSIGLRSLAIREKVFGSENSEVASSLNSLGNIYIELQMFNLASKSLERALAINESIYGQYHRNTSVVVRNLARLYEAIKQYDKAWPFAQRALSIDEISLPSHHPSIAAALSNVADILAKTGQPESAIMFYKFAINITQSHREQISHIGSDELESYTGTVASTYQDFAQLLLESGRISEAQLVLDMLKEDEQFDFVRRSEKADPRRTRIGYSVTETAWMSRYRSIADRLTALGAEMQTLQKKQKLGLTPEQEKRKKELTEELLVAQKAFHAFLNEMRDHFARSGLARASDITELKVSAVSELQTLIQGLGDDAVLLQYYVTDDQVGMLLTTSGVQLARRTKIKSTELNRQIAEFRRLLRDPKSNLLPVSQALYQLLVAPVAQDLDQAGVKTVMLSLDGALRYLPFGALHDGQGYLAQRWNLPIYTSVTKSRLQDAVTPKWQAAGLGLTKALGEFAALPAVKAEMKSIVKNGDDGVMPGEVHLDAAFTAARLKDVSQRSFQLLHVASHFRFSPGTEVNSFLLLGDGQHLTLGDIRTQNLRFDNVDMLTLSACDTGLGGGRDAQGREIEGFGVIAQQQGAKAVLATLWPVADSSTADLMADMYRRRQTLGINKAEALRQAQVAMLHGKYSHPFYWAPFILMGNWK